MKKLALAIGLTMGMAAGSGPALADESGVKFVVQNYLDYTIYAGCGPQHAAPPGSRTDITDCQELEDLHIRRELDGDSVAHAHNCPDPEYPVHLIEVNDSSTTATLEGELGMEFFHVCVDSEGEAS